MSNDEVMKVNVLAEAILAEGETITFTQDETEKIGMKYLKACFDNEKEERAHRAEVMKGTSLRIFF
ncbi:MAG: hypothetical protein LBF80_06030 [Spirochaetaceae bacterium]|jgi:hypothetical protein|nr:hypothetical protein [Spirochaetaceae bacterium]